MKKLIIALAALSVSAAAYGQGAFVFNNRIGTEVSARFVMQGDAAGQSTIGSDNWSVQLFGGPVGTAVDALQPLNPPTTTFRGAAGSTTAGYVTSATPTVPGVAIQGNASILVRVVNNAGQSQDFGPYTVNGLGGDTFLPPNLQLGTSPLVVTIPEPTTLALAALGLGAMLFIRRRS